MERGASCSKLSLSCLTVDAFRWNQRMAWGSIAIGLPKTTIPFSRILLGTHNATVHWLPVTRQVYDTSRMAQMTRCWYAVMCG